jgi:hypothetical protein
MLKKLSLETLSTEQKLLTLGQQLAVQLLSTKSS